MSVTWSATTDSLIAAGSSDLPAHLPAQLGCSASCGTVVWVRQNGRPWRAAFATQQNNGGNALIPTRHGLALLSPGIQSLDGGASTPPRSKAGIRAMFRDPTPAWIAGPAALSEGQTIYSIGEDDTGLPTLTEPNDNSEPAWVSPNGVRWPAGDGSQTFKWHSAVRVRGGVRRANPNREPHRGSVVKERSLVVAGPCFGAQR